MGSRVTAEEVREIIGTTTTDATIVTSMIDTAHLFVDTHLLTLGHSDAVLTKIELYLSAHVVAVTEEVGPLRSVSVGDASESYSTFNLGAGFGSTRFGQMAMVFDTTGTLKQLGGSPQLKAQLTIV